MRASVLPTAIDMQIVLDMGTPTAYLPRNRRTDAMQNFEVSVDVVDRYTLKVKALDAQDALLQIEHGHIRPQENSSATFISRSLNPIHVRVTP